MNIFCSSLEKSAKSTPPMLIFRIVCPETHNLQVCPSNTVPTNIFQLYFERKSCRIIEKAKFHHPLHNVFSSRNLKQIHPPQCCNKQDPGFLCHSSFLLLNNRYHRRSKSQDFQTPGLPSYGPRKQRGSFSPDHRNPSPSRPPFVAMIPPW